MPAETTGDLSVNWLDDFKAITKMRLALSVVFSSLAGYLLAAETINYYHLLLLAVGGYCLVGASNAFNQIIEKDLDALMLRTQNRPLPANRMRPKTALVIAVGLTVLGIAMLYLLNWRTAFFGSISIFIYVAVYTPLKTRTPLSVFVGAFPGAIPFMLGWVAYTNYFGVEPGVLFMLQFFWQFPHFWAIAWMLDEDYKKAGFKMLPTGQKDQGTAFQIMVYTLVDAVDFFTALYPLYRCFKLEYLRRSSCGYRWISHVVLRRKFNAEERPPSSLSFDAE